MQPNRRLIDDNDDLIDEFDFTPITPITPNQKSKIFDSSILTSNDAGKQINDMNQAFQSDDDDIKINPAIVDPRGEHVSSHKSKDGKVISFDNKNGNGREHDKNKNKYKKVIPFNQSAKSNSKSQVHPKQQQTNQNQTKNKIQQKQNIKNDQHSTTDSNDPRPGQIAKSAVAERILKANSKESQLNRMPAEINMDPEQKELANILHVEQYVQTPIWFRPVCFENSSYIQMAAKNELTKFSKK